MPIRIVPVYQLSLLHGFVSYVHDSSKKILYNMCIESGVGLLKKTIDTHLAIFYFLKLPPS